MSLETPEKIRNLQRKLYCKAKAEPAFRFYILYDKICRDDVLRHAYALARANAGAPGVDGTTFEQIDVSGVEAWLAGLREDLVSKTRWPAPMRARRGWTGRPSSRLTRRTWRRGWRACARNSCRRPIGPIRCDGRRSRSRGAANVPSASRRFGIGGSDCRQDRAGADLRGGLR